MKFMNGSRVRGGFTLIEVAVAIIVVGIAVVALMTAVAAGTRVSGADMNITQAAFIVQELREWTLRLPFSDPDASDALNPPGRTRRPSWTTWTI